MKKNSKEQSPKRPWNQRITNESERRARKSYEDTIGKRGKDS